MIFDSLINSQFDLLTYSQRRSVYFILYFWILRDSQLMVTLQEGGDKAEDR